VSIEEDFTIDSLHRVRSLVEAAAGRIGLTGADLDALVTAVNEIAINAVLHAGGRGRLRIQPSPGGITVEISDTGPGLPDTAARPGPPPADATSGRGLWLARLLCPSMAVTDTGRGLTVRFEATAALDPGRS
jgi:anti-sigma regulatory factor (Ser/Thr protein kinase)